MSKIGTPSVKAKNQVNHSSDNTGERPHPGPLPWGEGIDGAAPRRVQIDKGRGLCYHRLNLRRLASGILFAFCTPLDSPVSGLIPA